MRTLQEFADRLARIALAYCDIDDPDADEQGHARHDLAILTGKFMAELRPIYPQLEPKKGRYSRGRVCSLSSCGNRILNANKSGICTQCWNERPAGADAAVDAYFAETNREADRQLNDTIARRQIEQAMPAMSRMIEMFEPLTMPESGVKRGRVG